MSLNDKLGPLVRALVGVPIVMLGILMDIANRLAGVDGEDFFQALKKFVSDWKVPTPAASPAPEPAQPKIYLRELEVVSLDATPSAPTEEEIRQVFAGDVNPRLLLWKSKPAAKAKAAVNQLIENGKFPAFFGETVDVLEQRRWQWSQVVRFCDDHPQKLRKGGNANFFLITVDGEKVAEDLSNVFVVRVLVDDRGKLYADLGLILVRLRVGCHLRASRCPPATRNFGSCRVDRRGQRNGIMPKTRGCITLRPAAKVAGRFSF